MSRSVKTAFTMFQSQEEIELKHVIGATQVDLAAAKVDLAALRAAIVGITAQLDTDGGVTETDYAASFDPAALTLGPTLTA